MKLSITEEKEKLYGKIYTKNMEKNLKKIKTGESDSRKVILALHNIRSTHNVGAIFRTADAVGIDEIFLIGITPDPVDRFGRKRSDIAKAALGAEETILWQHFSDEKFLEKVSVLKNEGFQIISVEQGANSVDYKNIKTSEKVLIITGSEVDGLPKEVTGLSDFIAEIPMRGKKESLNVSVATGVALFRILGI
jgi:tRNA G18 (ribose-2'-O)-methylase SpoU